jgi:hypothetical protein
MWDDPLGSFEFRGVCGWQDDACQRIFPFSAIGANHQSLFDYQEEVRQREATGRQPQVRITSSQVGMQTSGRQNLATTRSLNIGAARYN